MKGNMRKLAITFTLALVCVCAHAQTIVNKVHRVKETLITWSVAGNDTIFTYPVTDFGDALRPTIFLNFIGSNNLIKTLSYLSDAKLDDDTTVMLDYSLEKNVVTKGSPTNAFIGSGFFVYNTKGKLPEYVYLDRSFVRKDLKRFLKRGTK